jgi:hypothetical protein
MKLNYAAIFAIVLGACERKTPPGASDPRSGEAMPGQNRSAEEKIDPEAPALGPDKVFTRANCTILEAAKIYEAPSGKKVIMETEMADQEVSFTLGGPLTNEEFAKFLQLTLVAEGVAILPVPGEEGIVRFIQGGIITPSGHQGLPRFFNEADLPEDDDEVVIYVMSFQNIAPEEGLRILQAELGSQTDSGSITAVANDSSLIITERCSLVRKMIAIRKRIDVSSPVPNEKDSKLE